MIGKTVGKYKVLGEIGRGGMGVVYKGLQISLNRTVALKMLPPQFALSKEFLERFQREARILARLAHKNIVHIYDLEEIDGAYFIIMEFIEGKSVAEIIAAEAPVSLGTVKKVAIGVASALSAAHQAGIVHRDIKPENIMIDKYNEIKVMDFGVARVADESFKTRAGIRLGTPEYMSPEQAKGLHVDEQSDIYSLGVVLYEMVTGRVPFSGDDSIAIALKHIQEPVIPPTRINQDLLEDVERVILKTLEKDKQARYESADEFCAAFDAISVPEDQIKKEKKALAFQYCPECGASVKKDMLSCPSCGLSVRRVCPFCRKIFDAVFSVCPHCSKELPSLEAKEGPKTAVQDAGTAPVFAPKQKGLRPPEERGVRKSPALDFRNLLEALRNPRALAILGASLVILIIGIIFLTGGKKPAPPLDPNLNLNISGGSGQQTQQGQAQQGQTQQTQNQGIVQPDKTKPKPPEKTGVIVPPGKDTAALLAQARDYIDRGAFDMAISSLDQVLDEEPANGEAQALKDKAVQAKPAVEAHLARAKELVKEGLYRECVEECEKILAVSPKHFQASQIYDVAKGQVGGQAGRLKTGQQQQQEGQQATGGQDQGDRARIAAIINRQKRAMERKDTNLLVQDVVPALYDEILRDAEEFFNQNDIIQVTFSNVRIDIEGMEAMVNFLSTIIYKPLGGMQQSTQSMNVSWSLQRISGVWKITEF